MSGSDPKSGALLKLVASDPEWWREDALSREQKARRDMCDSALYGAGGLALCGVLIYQGATGASGGYLGWMFICVYAALFVFGVRSYRSDMRKRRRVLAAANQLLGIRKVVMMNHVPQFRGQLDLFTGEPAEAGVTIGTVTHEGVTYEVDWPYSVADETKRGGYGYLYRDGRSVSDFINQDWRPGKPYAGFSSAEEVLDSARRFLASGGAK